MPESLNEFEVWKSVIARLKDRRSTPAAAARIATDAIEPALTAKQASSIRSIDFEADVEPLRTWFSTLLRTDPPPSDVDAFYFGLFTQSFGLIKKSTAPAMYIGGSNCFDPDDQFSEWACDPVWFPDHRYPRVQGFRRLARTLPSKGLLADIVADAFVFALAEDLVSQTDRALVLGDRPWRAVGSGYDSGDAYIVGYITQDGFLPDGPPA